MPQRPAVTGLPEEVKKALDDRLVQGGFCGYQALSDWLDEQGYQISRSALQRYGQRFEERIAAVKDATDMAAALSDHVGDDAGKMSDAVTRLYQERLFQVLVDMRDLDPDDIDFVKLGRTVAEITKSSVAQKKWMAEVREKATATAEEVKSEVRKGGLSEEKAEEIKKKILGIV